MCHQLTSDHQPVCMCHCIVLGINPRVTFVFIARQEYPNIAHIFIPSAQYFLIPAIYFPTGLFDLGPVYTKRQHQHYDHSAMTLVILFSLKSIEMLKSGLQTKSGASSQSCCSIEANAWWKRVLKMLIGSIETKCNLIWWKIRFHPCQILWDLWGAKEKIHSAIKFSSSTGE